ncbi:hypothetical protein GCM10027605_25410 [Micromonospora zhanjiangensis]
MVLRGELGALSGAPTPGRGPFARRDGEVPRFVVHLPVVVTDLAGAKHLARRLAVALLALPEVDGGETTVSEEDNQGVRHRVFCDRLLADGRRCGRQNEHDGGCVPGAVV